MIKTCNYCKNKYKFQPSKLDEDLSYKLIDLGICKCCSDKYFVIKDDQYKYEISIVLAYDYLKNNLGNKIIFSGSFNECSNYYNLIRSEIDSAEKQLGF